ncbi:MAG: cellulose binding domain-containing protein [Ilumatobacter sp.]|nr:cellulose binding domain-containing protein [Ilumatobacter sp.]
MNKSPRARRREPDDGRLDRGASLIEMLVAVVLLGTAGVAVLLAMATTTIGARNHDEIANVQTWLASTGDRLMASANNESVYAATNSEVPGYVPCSEATTAEILVEYQSQVDALLSGSTGAPDVRVDAVRYWNGTSFDGSCHWNQNHRLQQIVLSAAVPNGEREEFIVLRRPFTEDEVPVAANEPDSNGDGHPDAIAVDENPYIHGPTTTTSSTTSTTSTSSTTTTTVVGPGPTTTTVVPPATTTTSTTSTTSTTTSSTATTTAPSTTVAPTTTIPRGLHCSATVVNKWDSGYQIDTTVTRYGNGTTNGWTVRLVFPNQAVVTNSWSANISTQGTYVYATPMSWNAKLSSGQSATFGVQGPANAELPAHGNPVPCEVM